MAGKIGSSGESLDLPEAPRIPGLVFRRFKGEADFPEMADVQQKSRDADLIDMVDTVEDLANEFRNPIHFEPCEDVLLVEMNGTLIGYAKVSWEDRYQDVRTYPHFAHLMPDWRNTGIRRAMLRHNERRIRDMARSYPGNRPRYFETMTNHEDNDWKSLVIGEGYAPQRHNFLMIRPDLDEVPDLQLPQGIEVRPVKPEEYKIIWAAAAEAFRDERNFGVGFWEPTGYAYFKESRWFSPELWQIAWDGPEVAAGVINFVDVEENKRYGRNWGYTGGVFTRKPWRNRGVASALLARSFVVLREQGVDAAALGVDTENPSGALRLYERMGFRPVNQYTFFRKPLD